MAVWCTVVVVAWFGDGGVLMWSRPRCTKQHQARCGAATSMTTRLVLDLPHEGDLGNNVIQAFEKT